MERSQPEPEVSAAGGLSNDPRIKLLEAQGLAGLLPPCPPWPDLN
jgi:hypothetical protein